MIVNLVKPGQEAKGYGNPESSTSLEDKGILKTTYKSSDRVPQSANLSQPLRSFLSPNRRPNQAITNLRDELLVLREDIGKMLSEEDRKRLEARRKLMTSPNRQPNVGQFHLHLNSSPALSSQANTERIQLGRELQRDRDAIEIQKRSIQKEKQRLEEEQNSQKNTLNHQNTQIESERQSLKSQRAKLQADRRELDNQRQALETQFRALNDQKRAFEVEKSTVSNQLQRQYSKQLSEQKQFIAKSQRELKMQRAQLDQEHQILIQQKQSMEALRHSIDQERQQIDNERQAITSQKHSLNQKLSYLQTLESSLGQIMNKIENQKIALTHQAEELTTQRNLIQLAIHQKSLQVQHSNHDQFQILQQQCANLQTIIKQMKQRSQQQDLIAIQQENLILKLQTQGEIKDHTIENLQSELTALHAREKQVQELLRSAERELQQQHLETEKAKQSFREITEGTAVEKQKIRLMERQVDQKNLIEALEQKLKQQAHDYEGIIKNLQVELQHQRNLPHKSNFDLSTIDEALRGQFMEVEQIKRELEKKIEQVFGLKDEIKDLESQNTKLRADIEVEKLHKITEKKHIEVAHDIESQNLRHELGTERRLVENLTQKLKSLNEESKKKDSFIQSYLIGRKLEVNEKVQLKEFFDKYSEQFPLETYVDRFRHDLQKS